LKVVQSIKWTPDIKDAIEGIMGSNFEGDELKFKESFYDYI